MSDTDNKDPKEPQSADLPGLSSHFSTTLTGLKPMRRRSKATTSVEVEPPITEPPVAEPPAEPEPPATPEPMAEAAPEPPVEAAPEPTAEKPQPSSDSVSLDPDQVEVPKTDPLEGIELRPGLSLVDTAEIPIHRASAAAKLKAVRETPPAPELRREPPSPPTHTPSRMPPAYEETPRSARRDPTYSNTNTYWLYGLVMILIAALITVFVLQVKDLF